jgi:hypothetical protein
LETAENLLILNRISVQMGIVHGVLGRRVNLPVQPFCPTEVGKVIGDCLTHDPQRRPTFDQIVSFFESKAPK